VASSSARIFLAVSDGWAKVWSCPRMSTHQNRLPILRAVATAARRTAPGS